MRAPKNPLLRGAIEVGFIIFLFYANLLMGEFTATTGHHKTLIAAIVDMVTLKNFAIALVTSIAGYLGFEALRERSQS